MQELSEEQLKKLLNASHIEGTTEQIRLLGVRVKELCMLNGTDWVEENSTHLLDQWNRSLIGFTPKDKS